MYRAGRYLALSGPHEPAHQHVQHGCRYQRICHCDPAVEALIHSIEQRVYRHMQFLDDPTDLHTLKRVAISADEAFS